MCLGVIFYLGFMALLLITPGLLLTLAFLGAIRLWEARLQAPGRSRCKGAE
jgi:hypothetical protein